MRTVKASAQGLALVDQARQRKGWTKTRTPIWWDLAHTTQATLRRFWRGKAIQVEAFSSICQTVGISDWQALIDRSPEPNSDPMPIRISPTDWLIDRSPKTTPAAIPDSGSDFKRNLYQDWENAPDVNHFYGRTGELSQLEQWICTDRCKLVVLLGMGGMGKTTLAVALADALQDKFAGLIWRSLHPAPSLPLLLSDLVSFLSQQAVHFSATEVHQGITRLIECLQHHRFLVILDGMDALFRSSEGDDYPHVGTYQEGYADYYQLLQRLSQERHQSCVLVTSREKPTGVAALEGKTLPVRCLQLQGLQEQDARELLKAKGFLGTEPKLAELVSLYRGHPLALKVITTLIQEVFDGSITTFVNQNTIVVPRDLRALIQQQLQRLSHPEREIVYWLTIAAKPITLLQLDSYLLNSGSGSGLLMAIMGLERRSLLEDLDEFHLEDPEDRFTLQPLVMKVVAQELIEQALSELFAIIDTQTLEPLNLLRSYALIQPTSSEVANPSDYWLLNRLKHQLYAKFKNEQQMQTALKSILPLFKHQSFHTIGYAGRNLMELFRILGIEAIDDWQDILIR